jgi:hypothetical protein
MEKHKRDFENAAGTLWQLELQEESEGLFFWEDVTPPSDVEYLTGETNLVSESLDGKIYSYLNMPPDIRRRYGDATGHPFP